MPYLTPEDVPEGRDCRALLIPDDPTWLALVSGALTELTKPWNWQRFGALTVEETIAQFQIMIDEYYAGGCGGSGCTRIYRNSETGHAQQSDDGGETWEETTGDAAVPEVEARTEPTPEERRCLAAANAANVLSQTYEAMLDAWTLDQSITYGKSVFAATVAGLIGAWLGIISAGAINLMLAIFASAYESLQNLTQDAWDEDFNTRIKCILYDVSSDDEGVVTFDYQMFWGKLFELASEVNQIEHSLLTVQITYMMNWIGADGLNIAGTTTAITTPDCNDCGEWEYWLTADSDPALWQFYDANVLRCTLAAYTAYAPGGEVVDKAGVNVWQTTTSAAQPAVSTIKIRSNIFIPSNSTVTEVGVRYNTEGAVNPIHWWLRVNDYAACNPPVVGGTGNLFRVTGLSISNEFLNASWELTFGVVRNGYVSRFEFKGTGVNPFV